jgi:penicillin-binding protein 1C
LKQYGVSRFLEFLHQHFSLPNLNRSPDDYGLSLITGGAELSLFEVVACYRLLVYRFLYPFADSCVSLHLFLQDKRLRTPLSHLPSNGILYYVFRAMRSEAIGLNAPFQWFFWKTGTSHGQRDAWAIGFSKEHIIGIWCGNATNESHPLLYGSLIAVPLLNRLFSLFPQIPFPLRLPSNLPMIEICKERGYLPNPHCPHRDFIPFPRTLFSTDLNCPFHQEILLHPTLPYRVTADCFSNFRKVTYFVVTPKVKYYLNNPEIPLTSLPPYFSDCAKRTNTGETRKPLEIIYPYSHATILLQTNVNVVFQAAHMETNDRIDWFLDQQYLNTTYHKHILSHHPSKGKHILKIMDSSGNTDSVLFFVK